MLTLRDLVESALEGRDPRLLARCDVHKILAIFDGLCIFDVDTLAGNLATSFAELQTALQPAAAPAFLGLLAATMAKKVAAQEPLLGAPPSTPSTGGPPFSSPPSSSSAPPVVVTVKMNGKVVAERTTLTVPPATTWEAVARMRLKAVLSADELASYASMPLSVGLFRSADMLPSDRLNAPISDCVASAKSARRVASCWHARFAPPSSITRTPASARPSSRSRWPSRPHSRGCAPHAGSERRC